MSTEMARLERLVRFAIAHRWLVLTLTLAATAIGIWSFTRLPIDATPDITNVQVQINTEAAGFSPLEAEQRVTFAIETALAGLPRLEYTRSLSRYGLSQVTVVFEDGTDIFFARQQVAERIAQVKSQLPPGLEPVLGPIATGMGEIFLYTLTSEPSAPPSRWKRLDRDGFTFVARLGGPASVAKHPGRDGGQRDRRFRPTDPRHAGPRAPSGVWIFARRRRGGAERKQSERQRGLHRTQRAATAGASSEPGAGYRSARKHRAGSQRWCAHPDLAMLRKSARARSCGLALPPRMARKSSSAP